MRPLVILRPEPGASRTARRAAELGLAVQLYPLFMPRPLDWQPPAPGGFDALMVTSANTVRLAGEALTGYRTLPAYGVGPATAEELTAAGFLHVTAGDSDGTAIAARIAADGHRHVLHLAGQTVASLDPGPLHITRVAVYEMARTSDDDGLAAWVQPGSVLLVHSPRAGEILAQRMPPEQRAKLHLIAISPAALAACGTGWASAEAPDRPDDERMLALAVRLCE